MLHARLEPKNFGQCGKTYGIPRRSHNPAKKLSSRRTACLNMVGIVDPSESSTALLGYQSEQSRQCLIGHPQLMRGGNNSPVLPRRCFRLLWQRCSMWFLEIYAHPLHALSLGIDIVLKSSAASFLPQLVACPPEVPIAAGTLHDQDLRGPSPSGAIGGEAPGVVGLIELLSVTSRALSDALRSSLPKSLELLEKPRQVQTLF